MDRGASFQSRALSLLSSTAISIPVRTLEPNGNTINMDPAASAIGGEVSLWSRFKAQSDKIVFSPNAFTQIRFVNDTKLVVEACALSTPTTMTLGVRGTPVDIKALSANSSGTFLAGLGHIYDAGGACIVAPECECVLHVARGGKGVTTPTGQDGQQQLTVYFPFISGQEVLDPTC